MTKLTWNDLLITDVSPSDARTWLEPWSCFVHGQVSPVFLSKFGDWFLRRPDGSTDKLSILEGTFTRVAESPEEFAACVNSVEWQEIHLLSYQVFQLHEKGLIPGEGQCYALAPPPFLSGSIDIEHASIMSLGLWQSICAQAYFQTRAGA